MQGITAHTEAVGAIGDIAINLYNNVTVNASSNAATSYGVQASTDGKGNISVITNPGDVINSGSNGINAVNLAPVIEASYDSSIVVTANGTIHSRSATTGTGNQPAGISAGYLGPAPGGAVTTTYPLTNVYGDVVVNSSANIIADAGDGIRAYDYGIGDVFVNMSPARSRRWTSEVLRQGWATVSWPPTTAPATYVSRQRREHHRLGLFGIVAINKAPSTSGALDIPDTSEASVLAFGTIRFRHNSDRLGRSCGRHSGRL